MYKKFIFTISLILSSLFFTPNLQAQDDMLGEVKMFAGNFAPRGWAKCEGQLLPISQYSALFSLLGTTYGGDGKTTFGLPDLRGRVPMGSGKGPGLSPRKDGEKAGVEAVTLTISQMPSHSHSTAPASVAALDLNPEETDEEHHFEHGNESLISVGNQANTTVITNEPKVKIMNTGGSQPVQNVQPSLGINFIIALEGYFPSRG